MTKKIHDIKLIFAIGNPENEYSDTRHNIGIYFLKQVIKDLNLNLIYKKKFTCYISKHEDKIKNENIIFAISDTFMNNSGNCLLQIMNYYKIKENEILVVQDDMLLDPLEMLVKFNGSSHGHNGIKDIVHKINTDKFYKLKIGIGKPKHRSDNINYVLSKMQNHEKKKMNEKITELLIDVRNLKFLDIIKSLIK